MYNVFVEEAYALVHIWGKRTILRELILFASTFTYVLKMKPIL